MNKIHLRPKNTSTKTLLCMLFIYGLCLITPEAVAQHGRRSSSTIHAYPFIGATVSQVDGDQLKGFKKIGFTGGVGAITQLGSERWLMSLEAGYAQRGMHENSSREWYKVDLTLDYVDLPLMVHFKDTKGGMTIGAGLCYSRLVRQPHGRMAFNPNTFAPDTSDMTFLRNDLSVVGDIRFSAWRNLKLNIRVQYSLIPIKRDWKFTYFQHPTTPVEYIYNCRNFSITTRLFWEFGEVHDTRQHSRSRR